MMLALLALLLSEVEEVKIPALPASAVVVARDYAACLSSAMASWEATPLPSRGRDPQAVIDVCQARRASADRAMARILATRTTYTAEQRSIAGRFYLDDLESAVRIHIVNFPADRFGQLEPDGLGLARRRMR